MLYEINYEVNGVDGKTTIQARSADSAIRIFKEEWSEFGDEPPAAPWVSTVWSTH